MRFGAIANSARGGPPRPPPPQEIGLIDTQMFLHGMFPLSKTFIILYRYHTKFLSCHGTSLFTLFVIFNEI